jgi:hypothetical protein
MIHSKYWLFILVAPILLTPSVDAGEFKPKAEPKLIEPQQIGSKYLVKGYDLKHLAEQLHQKMDGTTDQLKAAIVMLADQMDALSFQIQALESKMHQHRDPKGKLINDRWHEKIS